MSDRWTLVIEVSRRWYEIKGALADQPCPPDSSVVVPLPEGTTVVGRSSSREPEAPDVPLDADTGVSRRHAQFVRSGDMLTVVDLSSTNGTYVVVDGDEPDESTPSIVPGVPVELGHGDRVFVGAWTCCTVAGAATG